MKQLFLLYCLLILSTINYAQNSIESINLFPIKIKIAGEKMQKGYLMDTDQTTVIFFTNKKRLKQNLLNGCQSCRTIKLDNIDQLILQSKKQHAGKLAGGFLALLITGIAANNPRGDGLDAGATAKIYGTYYGSIAIGLGAAIDGIINNSKKSEMGKRGKTTLIKAKKIDNSALNYLIHNTPKAQFEEIQQQQQLDLPIILQEIKNNPLMHQQRFSFFSTEQPVASGYLIGSDSTHLFLSKDLFSLIEDRGAFPIGYKKVRMEAIKFYQVD